jgi:phenylalanine-4-hydroxylase
MKTYKLKPNLKQNYSNYTKDDFAVWKILFERQMLLLSNLATPEYISAIHEIGFVADKIPDFSEINKELGLKSGWKLEVVEGIINENDFFELLANKKFPATTWLRKLNELDYLPEPDMFHDVFGHVPLLIDKKFSDFFETFGKIGVQHQDDPEIITMLGRLYWFTIEFGLIQNKDRLQIYGAGILSSHGESKYSVSKEPVHFNFDIEKIMNTDFNNSVIQNTYFIIRSFDELYQSINSIENIISKRENLITR